MKGRPWHSHASCHNSCYQALCVTVRPLTASLHALVLMRWSATSIRHLLQHRQLQQRQQVPLLFLLLSFIYVSTTFCVASMVAKHCTCTAKSVMRLLPLPGTDTNSKGKQLHTEWKWVFGEMAWDIQISSFTGEQLPLLVVPTTIVTTSSSLPEANCHACKMLLYSLLHTMS